MVTTAYLSLFGLMFLGVWYVSLLVIPLFISLWSWARVQEPDFEKFHRPFDWLVGNHYFEYNGDRFLRNKVISDESVDKYTLKFIKDKWRVEACIARWLFPFLVCIAVVLFSTILDLITSGHGYIPMFLFGLVFTVAWFSRRRILRKRLDL